MNNFYHMLRYGMVLAFICVIASTAVNAQESFNMEKRGLPVEGVYLTALLKQSAITPGDQVTLDLTVHNEGTKAQRFDYSNPLADFTLTVLDEKGQSLPQKKMPILFFVNTTARIMPYQLVSADFRVTRLFDFNKVGTYRITATRKIFSPDREHTSDIVSNTVILTVSDHLAKDITLTSALAKPSTETEKPMALSLTLKNTSKNPKTLTAKDLTDGYTLTVQDFRGEIILPVNKDNAGADEKASNRVLQPDETIVANIDIARRYDLHKEGRYFITASHNITDDKGQVALVISNTLMLTISNTAKPDEDYGIPIPYSTENRGLPNNGVLLIGTLERNAIAPGVNLALDIQIRNEGQLPQSYIAAWPRAVYSLTVQDQFNHFIPQKTIPDTGGSLLIANIQPNHEYETQYPLSQMYDINHIGIYRITAKQKIFTPDENHTSDVVSNTVILTVSDHLSKDYSLTSALVNAIVAADKPIALLLTLKNTSKAPKTLTAKDLTESYTLTVQDFRGDIILPTNKEKAGVDEKAVDRVLQPDETIVTNIDIAKLYDLHKEGRYFITASHNVTDDKGQLMQVYSNTAILTVSKTPPPDAEKNQPTTTPVH